MSERKSKKTSSTASTQTVAAAEIVKALMLQEQGMFHLAASLVNADPSVCMAMRERLRPLLADPNALVGVLLSWSCSIANLLRDTNGAPVMLSEEGKRPVILHSESLPPCLEEWSREAQIDLRNMVYRIEVILDDDENVEGPTKDAAIAEEILKLIDEKATAMGVLGPQGDHHE